MNKFIALACASLFLAVPTAHASTTVTFESVPNNDIAAASAQVADWGDFSLSQYGEHPGTVAHGFGQAAITFTGPVTLEKLDLWGDFEAPVAFTLYRGGVAVYDQASSSIPAGADGLGSLSVAYAQPVDSIVFDAQSDGVVIDNLQFTPAISAVPEPTAPALIGMGLAVLGLVARQRRAR